MSKDKIVRNTDLIDSILIRGGEPIKDESMFTIIPIEHLPQPEQLKDFCVESGNIIKFPPYEDIQICKARRTSCAPEEYDYFVAVLINEELRWLSLDPATMLKCLSGLTVTVK